MMRFYKLYLAVLLSLMSVRTIACDCSGKPTIQEDFKSSDIVIYGVVVSSSTLDVKKNNPKRICWPKQVFIIKATVVYKGESQQKEFRITTGLNNADCGFAFEIGKSYIVYASYLKKNLQCAGAELPYTSNCGRTTEYNKRDARVLKRIARKL